MWPSCGWPGSHMACVWDRIQTMTAVKQTGLPFLSLLLFRPQRFFFHPHIHFVPYLLAPLSSFLHSHFPLCSSNHTLCFYAPSPLSSCFPVCHVTGTNHLLLKADRKPRGSVVTCVLTCRPESLTPWPRLWIITAALYSSNWLMSKPVESPPFQKTNECICGKMKVSMQEILTNVPECVGKCRFENYKADHR